MTHHNSFALVQQNSMSSLLDSLINSMKMADTPPAITEVSGMIQNASLITESDLHGLVIISFSLW